MKTEQENFIVSFFQDKEFVPLTQEVTPWVERTAKKANASDKMKATLLQGSAKHFGWFDFTVELFNGVFSPVQRELEQISHINQWAKKAHDKLGEISQFDLLRSKCCNDALSSAMAVSKMGDYLIQNNFLPKKDISQDPRQLEQEKQELEQKLQQDKQLSQEQIDQIKKEIAKLKRQKGKVEKDLQEWQEEQSDMGLRLALREAVKTANEGVDLVAATCQTFGSEVGNPTDSMSIKEAMSLVDIVRKSPKLLAILQEAGRLQSVAKNKQNENVAKNPVEVHSIEVGGKIEQLLPEELALLMTEETEVLFYRGLLEEELLQYELVDTSPKEKGPIVVMLDNSGSMSGYPEVWSKAVALALMMIAVKQNRSCRIVHFDGVVGRVDDFPKDEKSVGDRLKRMIDSMNYFSGGGTSFEAPLAAGVEGVALEPNLKEADLILITDGYSSISDQFAKWFNTKKKEYGFALYSVIIGSTDRQSKDAPGQLGKVVDPGKCIYLSALTDEIEATNQIFAL